MKVKSARRKKHAAWYYTRASSPARPRPDDDGGDAAAVVAVDRRDARSGHDLASLFTFSAFWQLHSRRSLFKKRRINIPIRGKRSIHCNDMEPRQMTTTERRHDVRLSASFTYPTHATPPPSGT